MKRGAGRPEQAVDPDAGPVERLAWELRRLREQAGGPSYRALAKRAHYSASTLAEAARGRRLPTLDVTLAYVEACGGDREEWTARWRAAAESAGAAMPERPDDEECPYPGLAAFQERDARWFFGRDVLVGRLADRLREQDGRGLSAVFGASGSGKSSLVRAGLIPALPDGWRPALLTPARIRSPRSPLPSPRSPAVRPTCCARRWARIRARSAPTRPAGWPAGRTARGS